MAYAFLGSTLEKMKQTVSFPLSHFAYHRSDKEGSNLSGFPPDMIEMVITE